MQIELNNVSRDERSLADIARLCYKSESKGEEADYKLLRLLLSNKHESVFEHLYFTFKVTVPIYVARQWMRHRIGSYTEKSLRYTKPESFELPLSLSDEVSESIKDFCNQAFNKYQKLIDMGVSKEKARSVLPLCTQTEFYWTVNVRALLNFLKLRFEAHAQEEIRWCAEQILIQVQGSCPNLGKLFKEILDKPYLERFK